MRELKVKTQERDRPENASVLSGSFSGRENLLTAEPRSPELMIEAYLLESKKAIIRKVLNLNPVEVVPDFDPKGFDAALASLSYRERLVLKKGFGLPRPIMLSEEAWASDWSHESNLEIAADIRVCRDTIQNIKTTAFEKLRRPDCMKLLFPTG